MSGPSSAPGALSLKPSDFVSGGGLLDEATVTIESCRAALWDYNGKIPTPIVAMAVTMQPHADAEGNIPAKVIQYYSAGDPKFFVPSSDGRMFVPVGGATGLNENTNASAFILSLLNAVNGFPEDKVDRDLGVFDGTVAFVKRMPQPKRPGLEKQSGQGDGKILLVQKILSFPWELTEQTAAPAPKKKAASAPKVATQATTQAQGPTGPPAGGTVAPSGELADEGVSTMLALLSAKGGTITKAQIAQEAFKVLQKHPMRNELMKLLYSDGFLQAGPWQFDGTTVTMG